MSRRAAAAAMMILAGCGSDGDPAPDADPAVCTDGDIRGDCPSWEACEEGDCADRTFESCERGEWGRVYCEGNYVDVIGAWTLNQRILLSGKTCPALTPREPLLFVVDGEKAVTAEPPAVIVEATALGDYDYGTLEVTITDDWSGLTPTIDYYLSVNELGAVQGGGALTLGDCAATVEAYGTLVE